MRNACIVGLLGMFVALGCGSSDEPTSATPSTTPTPAQGADATKKRSPEVVAAKRADAEKAANAQITQGELPAGFPSDVPIFPDAQPKTSMMVGSSGLVVLTSSASLADVLAHYREQLPSQGWTVDTVKEGAGGDKASVRAHKDSRLTTISISKGKDGGTEIGIAMKAS